MVAIQFPYGITVHEVSGIVLFTDMTRHRIMMFDSHYPSNMIDVAVLLGHSRKKDGNAAQFSSSSDIPIWNNLLFVRDSFNHCIRIIDIDILKRGLSDIGDDS